jgi:hypothetical protein
LALLLRTISSEHGWAGFRQSARKRLNGLRLGVQL